jgi:Rieske 2Fe-2S family protein
MTAIDEPVTSSYLLPPAAYTSQEWFDREQRELFDRCWGFVAMTDDFPEIGDYLAVQVGTHPIIVVRGLDGELRAFHNLCRHRGMVMLEGSGNVRTGISCLYHHWNYGLEGKLRRVPQLDRFGDMEMTDWGLLPAAIGISDGLVFVHPDPGAEPLAEWLGDFQELTGRFRPDLLQQGCRLTYEMSANWKLFAENHIDVLHLWYLHARTLSEYDHANSNWVQCGRHWVFYEPPRNGKTVPASLESAGMPVIDHIAASWYGSGAHLVFPNLPMASGANFWMSYQVIPLSPGRSRLDMRLRAMPGTDPALLEAFAAAGRDLFEHEDIKACELMQLALQSPKFTVGPLARSHEDPILVFQRNVLDYVPVRP